MGEITERSLYPILIQFIKEHGGSGVSEVKYNAEPDIIFRFQERQWILGVKIGETIPILKQAFIQYHRHKDESRIDHGILLFFPESIRSARPIESILTEHVQNSKCTCLIDTPDVKDELRKVTFPQILHQIEQEIIPRLLRKEQKAFPINIVISLLQQHVSELMENAKLSDKEMLRIITDKQLLSEIGHLTEKEAYETSRFLASYIVLSQIMFLRLFSRTRKEILPNWEGKITYHWLRSAFLRIRDINYRPIYDLDVLDAIPEAYIQDTFDLIWGLEIERVKHELPGRIFHELMPNTIRKMLAAFYTRPQAADLLARLTIKGSNETLFDPACGSGTIIIAGYKRKHELYSEEGHVGNPHKRFCEEEIYGSDIMPFAVHLTGANLASMDPATTIDRTQIIQGDTLELSRGYSYKNGVQLTLFPKARTGYTTKGETHEVKLDKVDVVLMNPPFTKVERGISEYVDMDKFGNVCGNEVGLWGHFIAFADEFLKDDGIYGGVIPISILRGRESQKVRDFIFSNWTPLYIIKSTYNYGFSEWSEYRDILLIAKKKKPSDDHRVKFIMIKKDLRDLSKSDVSHIANLIELKDCLRTDELDIESFPITEIRKRFANLMWFCGVSNLRSRDVYVSFVNKFDGSLTSLPPDYFREGYRPVPEGVSSFMFLTRKLEESRIGQAFLSFDTEGQHAIDAKSLLGAKYRIEKTALRNTLRTGIGINVFDLTGKLDYIAGMPYKEFDRVLKASKFEKPKKFEWKKYWENVESELDAVKTKIVAVHRINPFSPSTYLFSFFSEKTFSPSNVLNVIKEEDKETAKAVCTLLNSALFLSQFFLLKEETTGRYINVRFYDYYEMNIFPKKEKIKKLSKVFDEYSGKKFPSLREQFDNMFDMRYAAFWEEKRKGQKSLFSMKEPVNPSIVRMNYDLSVCKALGVPMTKKELSELYKVIVDEMIITRGLTRD
jgi:hypothetical protein